MDTFEAMVTQFLQPNGLQIMATVDLPMSVKANYLDMLQCKCRLEAEIISTDEVSLTVTSEEYDVDIEVVGNGPVVIEALTRMLQRAHWKSPESE
jgi:hypothetical protein